MIAPIETHGVAVYRTRMRSLVLRLLTLVAVALMPFGMSAAPAAATHHEHMLASPSPEHCPDGNSQSSPKGLLADCTMACASALPAADLTIVGWHPVSRSAPQPAIEPILSNIDLEIATPPPRRS